jgi:hypothetical protein
MSPNEAPHAPASMPSTASAHIRSSSAFVGGRLSPFMTASRIEPWGTSGQSVVAGRVASRASKYSPCERQGHSSGPGPSIPLR